MSSRPACRALHVTTRQTFGTFVNPIGLDPVNGIGYKFMVVYCCWIAFEGFLIWWIWPETSGHTLEELAFRKSVQSLCVCVMTSLTNSIVVFEDPGKIQLQTATVESKMHPHADHERSSGEKPHAATVETEHI